MNTLIYIMEKGDENLCQNIQKRNRNSSGKLYFTREELLELMIIILKSYNFLDALGIIHRDIKPHNIILVKGVWKLIDFDISIKYELNYYL